MASKSATRYVALLRGVNVGGNNKLPMASLADLFRQANCEDARTFIQSGNVIFSADAKTAKAAPELVCKGIKAQFGFNTVIVMRSESELGRIAESHPFFKPDIPDGLLHVSFLASLPSAEHIATLDSQRSPPDQFEISGSEIYLYFPNGMAKTKLTSAYFDSKLKTVGTMRNWRTVRTLLELMRAK